MDPHQEGLGPAAGTRPSQHPPNTSGAPWETPGCTSSRKGCWYKSAMLAPLPQRGSFNLGVASSRVPGMDTEIRLQRVGPGGAGGRW